MVNYCAVIGCNNTGGRDTVSFYRLPAEILNQGEKTQELSKERRRTWLSRISRADLTASTLKYMRVCSDHFVKGEPSPLYKQDDIDWAPTQKLGHDKLSSTHLPTPDRGHRIKQRAEKRKTVEAAQSLIKLFQSSEVDCTDTAIDPDGDVLPTFPEPASDLDIDTVTGTCTQTDLESSTIHAMETELNRLTTENVDLKKKLSSSEISEETFRDDNEKVKVFTGLPTFEVLMTVFMFIEPLLSHTHSSALSKFQQFVLVLMRLKLNLPVHYLADKFKISRGTVSRTFLNTLNVMFNMLKPFIYWPSREELCETMPMEFRKYFGLKIAVIIDCFEIFIERPSNLKARAQTWSSYKHHNTCKFLIGITPQGVISFLSNGYGGRASDKFITNDSGILDNLVYGDVVLADRGFDIADSVAQMSCELKIPAFTKGENQLSAMDVERTRKIAHVRIHVERVIGLVRNKFKILQDTLPIDYLQSSEGCVPTIDKIVTICCALTNFNKSVVPMD